MAPSQISRSRNRTAALGLDFSMPGQAVTSTALCPSRALLSHAKMGVGSARGRTVKPSALLQEHRDEVRRIIGSYRARNPRVFGSVARGEDSDESDLDILIDPMPGTSLFDIGGIRQDLLDLLGVEVDVVTPNALSEGVRADVLAEAVPL